MNKIITFEHKNRNKEQMYRTKEETDIMFMRRAIELAQKGFPYAEPNPLVGAVVVYNGKIIGEGYHRRCGGPHAEVNAVNSVKDKNLLSQATIYVTLEPCSHYGKTPPCADMLVRNNLKRVVVGCIDPFAKVCGNGINKLKEAGIEVTVGVCENECLELIKRFRTFHEQKRPYITLKWAQSADGYIDMERESGTPVIISNSFTRMLVHKMRSESAAIMVGTNTARLDNPSLTNRYWCGRNPVRIVIDRKLALNKSLHLFDGSVPTMVFTDLKEYKNRNNVEYITVPDNEYYINFILKTLHERNLQSLIVEGGRATLQKFIDKGIWDEAKVETASCIIGNGVEAPVLKNHIMLSSGICFGSTINHYIRKH